MRWTISFVAVLLFTAPLGCDLNSSTEPVSRWKVSGLKDRDVQALTVRAGHLYAATDSGLYGKPLGGETDWTNAGLQGREIVDVTWRADGSMIAGIDTESDETRPVLYRQISTAPMEWAPFDEDYGPAQHRDVRALAVIPTARDTLYARGAGNVARSVDGGEHWESVWGDWNSAGYQAPLLYVSPHDPSVVFAGGETSLFQPYLVRSPGYGTTWEPATGLPDDDNAVYSMIEHPTDPGRFLLGVEGRVLRSNDGGRTWATIYEPPSYTYVFDFVIRRMGEQTVVYAAGSEDGTQGGRLTLHRTDDFGDTWERVSHGDGPNPSATNSLALVQENGQPRLYLGTTVGVYTYRP